MTSRSPSTDLQATRASATVSQAAAATPRRATRRPLLLVALLAAVGLGAAGCTSLPRPIPQGDQPIAAATAGSVVVSVPRLDTGDYPGDILEISTAVLVVIENRGATEIVIDPSGFTLGAADGMRYSPLAPEQLAERKEPVPESLNHSGVALAWRGGGGGIRVAPPSGFGGGVRSAPAFRGGFGGGGVRVSPPSYGGYRGGSSWGGYRGGSSWGGYRGGSYGYRSYRPGYYASRPWWSMTYPGLWGPGWGYGWYGSSWWWSGPRYYAWSRADAAQMALPAGKLPPGGRTGGFLYFPRIDRPEGTPLVLGWQPKDVNGQITGDLQLPLEISTSE